jgi:hypothetical protein
MFGNSLRDTVLDLCPKLTLKGQKKNPPSVVIIRTILRCSWNAEICVSLSIHRDQSPSLISDSEIKSCLKTQRPRADELRIPSRHPWNSEPSPEVTCAYCVLIFELVPVGHTWDHRAIRVSACQFHLSLFMRSNCNIHRGNWQRSFDERIYIYIFLYIGSVFFSHRSSSRRYGA